jgi:type IV pilus assembly protein PilW
MSRARGFSLVELMVAITLALLVSAGVVSVFVGARSAYQATSGTAAVSDSGRFAMNALEVAARDAGYSACGAPVRTIFNVNLEPTPLYYTAGFLPNGLFQPMTGFEAVGTGVGNGYASSTVAGAPGNWIAPLAWPAGLDPAFASLAAQPGGLPIQSNDILVVRSSTQDTEPSYVTSVAGLSFTVTSVPANLSAPQMAVISDCVKSLIFQVSAIGGNTITHDIGTFPGNLTAVFPGNVSFAPGSQVTALQTTAYYIGLGADGDGALYSADVGWNNTLTASELAPDIEAMQILYGVDTTGTQTAGTYVTADQVADFTNVVSVEIALLAAGPIGSASAPAVANTYNLLGTIVTAPIDTRTRRVFAVTVGVRNSLP